MVCAPTCSSKTARTRKKSAATIAALSWIKPRVDYFDIDFLNMRSIFSLVASQHDWLA